MLSVLFVTVISSSLSNVIILMYSHSSGTVVARSVITVPGVSASLCTTSKEIRVNYLSAINIKSMYYLQKYSFLYLSLTIFALFCVFRG